MIHLFEYIGIALSNIWHNPLRSFLTMLGIIIGVSSVILLVSIGEGARRYVTEQFSDLGSNILIITPGGSQKSTGMPMVTDAVNKLTIADSEAIRRSCRSVKLVCPLILSMGTQVKFDKTTTSTAVIGTISIFQEVRNMHAEFGRFIPEQESQLEKHVCVLGRRTVRDLFGAGFNPIGQWIKIGGRNYRIIGIMAPKGVSLGFDLDDVIFIPIRAAEELFDTDELFEIVVNAQSGDRVKMAQEEITTVLSKRHNDFIDFKVTLQSQLMDSLGNIMKVLTYAIGGIAAISLLVGGIGIMNIMLVSVGEKTREIGIRKAVGAPKGAILAQFLTEAITLSSLGGVLGTLCGVGMGWLIQVFLPSLPVVVVPWSISVSFLTAVAIGVFFGVYPARRAANLDPIDALRYE